MADTAKHTPGPWKISRNGTIIESIGPCAPDEYAGAAWLEISEPDARLVAAAPDLLNTLKRIQSLSERCENLPDADGLRSSYRDIDVAARIAIAKAEGRA